MRVPETLTIFEAMTERSVETEVREPYETCDQRQL
jgi:hypothetical protein